jgi:hypothetical protein
MSLENIFSELGGGNLAVRQVPNYIERTDPWGSESSGYSVTYEQVGTNPEYFNKDTGNALDSSQEAKLAIAKGLENNGIASVQDIGTRQTTRLEERGEPGVGEGPGYSYWVQVPETQYYNKKTGSTLDPNRIGVLQNGTAGISGGDMFFNLSSDDKGNISFTPQWSPRSHGIWDNPIAQVILTLGSIIPSPIQPAAVAVKAGRALSEGKYGQAALAVLPSVVNELATVGSGLSGLDVGETIPVAGTQVGTALSNLTGNAIIGIAADVAGGAALGGISAALAGKDPIKFAALGGASVLFNNVGQAVLKATGNQAYANAVISSLNALAKTGKLEAAITAGGAAGVSTLVNQTVTNATKNSIVGKIAQLGVESTITSQPVTIEQLANLGKQLKNSTQYQNATKNTPDPTKTAENAITFDDDGNLAVLDTNGAIQKPDLVATSGVSNPSEYEGSLISPGASDNQTSSNSTVIRAFGKTAADLTGDELNAAFGDRYDRNDFSDKEWDALNTESDARMAAANAGTPKSDATLDTVIVKGSSETGSSEFDPISGLPSLNTDFNVKPIFSPSTPSPKPPVPLIKPDSTKPVPNKPTSAVTNQPTGLTFQPISTVTNQPTTQGDKTEQLPYYVFNWNQQKVKPVEKGIAYGQSYFGPHWDGIKQSDSADQGEGQVKPAAEGGLMALDKTMDSPSFKPTMVDGGIHSGELTKTDVASQVLHHLRRGGHVIDKNLHNDVHYLASKGEPVHHIVGFMNHRMAKGGITSHSLGSYSDGGHLLKGPGDGMSDDIPATIAGKQPARLANEEFVIPADVVSHLGNGSSESGAKVLYEMMARIRKARTGNPKQGKQIDPHKLLPKV